MLDEYPSDILIKLKEDNDGLFHPHYYNFKPDYIFHMACWPRVPYSVEKPVETMENNVLSTTYVLNFARKVGAKRVIYSSSSSVIGNGQGPESPYALQKLISEKECNMYSRLYNLDTVSLRYFNVYSPCQKVDGPYSTAIANWMEFIRMNKDPYITGDGEQKRDMVRVEDVVSANIFAMNYAHNFYGKVFDVGTGVNISLNEVKEIVLKSMSDKIKFNYVEERVGDVKLTLANTKPLSDIGWRHTISAKEGIAECFDKLKAEGF